MDIIWLVIIFVLAGLGLLALPFFPSKPDGKSSVDIES
jgi:hypothetical protein